MTQLGLALLLLALGPAFARGDEPREPPLAAIGGEGLHRVGANSSPERKSPNAETSTGGWWLGAAGLALALAGWGAVSLANRRNPPGAEAGTLKIVGRLSLSPRHAIHQVRVGDRVLLIGTGSQGPPALLGEIAAPERARTEGNV